VLDYTDMNNPESFSSESLMQIETLNPFETQRRLITVWAKSNNLESSEHNALAKTWINTGMAAAYAKYLTEPEHSLKSVNFNDEMAVADLLNRIENYK